MTRSSGIACILLALPCIVLGSEISLSTKDSLSLARNTYASILITATGNASRVPALYTFSESGSTPPGMIFESYPCNKPGHELCPSVAKPDGIFLDGVPTATGSYSFMVSAKDSKGNRGSKQFTVVVRDSK